jgi:hypothetical protein
MFNVLLAGLIFASAAVGFWFVLPSADGKVQPRITSSIEPVVAIVIVLAATLGVGLIIATVVAALT